MKNIIALAILLVAGVVGVSAQQSANEVYVGASYLRQNVEFVRPAFTFNRDTDSLGATVGYTRYLGGATGIVGIGGELTANFGSSTEGRLVTLMVGPTLKARNAKTVQPYIRGLVGVGVQHFDPRVLPAHFDSSNTSVAFDAGAGIDWRLGTGSRHSLRTGVDLVNTSFGGERSNGVRATLGVTF